MSACQSSSQRWISSDTAAERRSTARLHRAPSRYLGKHHGLATIFVEVEVGDAGARRWRCDFFSSEKKDVRTASCVANDHDHEGLRSLHGDRLIILKSTSATHTQSKTGAGTLLGLHISSYCRPLLSATRHCSVISICAELHASALRVPARKWAKIPFCQEAGPKPESSPGTRQMARSTAE